MVSPPPPRARTTLLTIGYAALPLERFLALLHQHDVEVVVDVRSQPYSKRAPPYRKRELERALKERGIAYFHLGQQLGGRPPAEPGSFQRGISRLVALAERRQVAILCAEEDPARCHRGARIAPALLAWSVAVAHIRGDGRLERADPSAPAGGPQLSLFTPAPLRLLFVCQGNICRSPMAEALAQARFGDRVAAESAGITPVYDGATLEAEAAMEERGLDISDHRSRSVFDLDLEEFDLVVALTPYIRARLPAVEPPTEVVTWTIDDPYGGVLEDYRVCAERIAAQLETLGARVQAGRGTSG
jgi:protein-tyrosine-phosphatase